MTDLTGVQKKYLRGLAHNIKPVVQIGQRGLTEGVLKQIEGALLTHELIKIRFQDFKQKSDKANILEAVTDQAKCHLAGQIGHTAILYRPHPKKDRRRIVLPKTLPVTE